MTTVSRANKKRDEQVVKKKRLRVELVFMTCIAGFIGGFFGKFFSEVYMVTRYIGEESKSIITTWVGILIPITCIIVIELVHTKIFYPTREYKNSIDSGWVAVYDVFIFMLASIVVFFTT